MHIVYHTVHARREITSSDLIMYNMAAVKGFSAAQRSQRNIISWKTEIDMHIELLVIEKYVG